MKLYHSGKYQIASNVVYPYQVDVQDVDQLLQAVKYDHVAAAYTNNRRATENFVSSDCLMMDVDNAPGKGQPDIPPEEWHDLDAIRADLPGVEFYAVTSRSHMIPKDGRPARPKYHLYFRIPETTDAKAYRRIKADLQARLPYFDANASDSARFFYGNDQAQAWFYPGSRLITEWIAATPSPAKEEATPLPISRPIPATVTQDNEIRLRDALNAIPCEKLSREDWYKVGMALNSLGWADGLSLWEAWSSTDSKRYKRGECAKKWRGFKPSGAINHTYIIHLAKEYGWTPPKKITQETKQPEKGEKMQDLPKVPEAVETEPEKPDTTAEVEQQQEKPSQVVLMLQDFQTKQYEPLPTGIEQIDSIINGGFFVQTLVTLGAHPGAGKTLIAQQMFEGIARSGKADICYINLEMSTQQLIARSLSRMTGFKPMEIMQGYSWTPEQKAAIYEAARQYESTIGKHFYYLQLDTAYYETVIQKMKKVEEERHNRDIPFIVVLDYIQLLQSKEKLDDVETIKASLKALKDFAMSKDRKALVFLIMAHSRALNESGAVTQGAGRDTSSLEYSADMQLSINYAAIASGQCKNKSDMSAQFLSGKLRKTVWNEYALVCTKNRFGKSGDYVPMRLEGEKSRFVMIDKQSAQDQQPQIKTRHVF